MSECNKIPFRYNRREATAAARCEVGVGDLPEKAAAVMLVCVGVTVAARIARNMPLPSFKMLGAYAAAAVGFIALYIYVRHRIKVTAAELMKREFSLCETEGGFEVYEFGDTLLFSCRYSEIERVERGQVAVKLTLRGTRICLPLSALPAEVLSGITNSTKFDKFRQFL